MISCKIKECKYSISAEQNMPIKKTNTNTRRNKKTVVAAVPVESPATTAEKENSIADAFAELVSPSDPPVIPDQDAPKKKCESCGKMVPEVLMTETFDGRTICEECFDKEDNRELLQQQQKKFARRSEGKWN